MPNTKTTALPAIDAVVGVDLFPIVDDVAGTPITKKATAVQVAQYVQNVFPIDPGPLKNVFAAGAGSTAITTSAESTGFGYFACANITSGGANNGFGYFALKEVTTGRYNVGVGTHALVRTTTGDYNTAIGVDTLYHNVTGGNNVAIGTLCLFRALGSNNVGIGSVALTELTTGENNCAIGKGAAQVMTSGASNTVLGYAALAACETGNNNVAIGDRALRVATSSGSVCIGYLSGYDVTTGSNNVLIGNTNLIAAAYGQVTTGSNNVSIGYATAVPSPTADNQLCISNYVYGTGMDGTGSTISAGRVGFGVKSPDYNVHVNGTLGIKPGMSVTPVSNGDVVFELTNNTTLTIRAKGSDGTVRSGTVTLA